MANNNTLKCIILTVMLIIVPGVNYATLRSLPTDDQVNSIIRLCAGGQSSDVQSTFTEAIQIWKSEAQGKGKANARTIGVILEGIEGESKHEIYRLYLDCIEKRLGITGDLGKVGEQINGDTWRILDPGSSKSQSFIESKLGEPWRWLNDSEGEFWGSEIHSFRCGTEEEDSNRSAKIAEYKFPGARLELLFDGQMGYVGFLLTLLKGWEDADPIYLNGPWADEGDAKKLSSVRMGRLVLGDISGLSDCEYNYSTGMYGRSYDVLCNRPDSPPPGEGCIPTSSTTREVRFSRPEYYIRYAYNYLNDEDERKAEREQPDLGPPFSEHTTDEVYVSDLIERWGGEFSSTPIGSFMVLKYDYASPCERCGSDYYDQ